MEISLQHVANFVVVRDVEYNGPGDVQVAVFTIMDTSSAFKAALDRLRKSVCIRVHCVAISLRLSIRQCKTMG